MEPTPNSNNKTARLAAFLFICVGLPLALWGEVYVPSKIFVPQDPVATADSLLSNEFIFRTSTFCHIAGNILFVLMSLMLYRILKPVDNHLSRLMIIPVLAQFPIVVVMEIFTLTALTILKSDPRPNFDVTQQQEVAYLLMRMARNGIGFTKLILGLSFIPWGMLFLRSGFIPRVFGVLVIISGVGYVADFCFNILLQRPVYLLIQPYARGAFIGFLVTMLWLLVKGTRELKVVTSL